MNKPNVLFYFTTSFPFEEGEPFINSEFPWLSKNFDKIVIITGAKRKPSVKLPENLEIHTMSEIMKGKNRIKTMLGSFSTINMILLSEFKNCNVKSWFLRNFRLYNSQLINSVICAEFIKNHKDFHSSATFYSFWMNEHALTLSLLKRKKVIDRFVFRVHGYDLIRERWPHSYMAFQHTCHKYVDKIFTVSRKSLEYFRNTYEHFEKATYSYLGSNDQGTNPQPQKGAVTLVSVSNIIPLKRLDLIVKILKEVNIKLNWEHFGSGHLRDEIVAMTKELPGNISVNFHGQVSQATLFEYYRTHPVNYFINVSNSEGLPFSIIEATSFGIPVIATDVGGTSEITIKQTGVLIPENFNSSEVAALLNHTEELPYHTAEFRQGVRKFWQQNFYSAQTYPKFIRNVTGKTDERKAPDNSTVSCTKCILTSSDTPNIWFDSEGVCNYCLYYERVTSELGNKDKKTEWLKAKVNEIKLAGENSEYDCILGVSGGVDSSYLSYWAKQSGLRPLVVHFDNGWNSELATENIRNICDRLGFSLNTYVINWEEFKELQLAYLRAGVVDIEALTDHAIMATIYKIAVKYKIKYTLSGFNYATEAIMPKGWVFDKSDWLNIKDIYSKYGSGKSVSSFPHLSFLRKLYNHLFLKLESIQVLNYIDYNKTEAKKIIAEHLSWRDYGGKHHESIFTKFYQSYILPGKFGIDKRKAHLATLINSGQITKQQALDQLKEPFYPSEAERAEEKTYILKKLGLSNEEFDSIMKEPVKNHFDFKTEKKYWDRYFNLIKWLRPWKK